MFAKIGSNQSSVTVSDAEALAKSKSGGFPEPRFKSGIVKAWNHGEFKIAEEKMIGLIEQAMEIKHVDNKYSEVINFVIKDTLNGKEYVARYGLVPTIRSSRSNSSYTGFILELPQGFTHYKEWSEKTGVEIKWSNRNSRHFHITIPASNPNKINAILPYLNDITNESLQQQALDDVNKQERQAMKDKRKVRLFKLHEELLSSLKASGFKIESRSYVAQGKDPEITEKSNSTEPDTIFESEIILGKDKGVYSDKINLQSKIDHEGNIEYSLGKHFSDGGIQKLSMIKLRKVLDIIKDES